MDGKNIAYIVGSALAVFIVYKLFAKSKDERKAMRLSDPNDMWELNRSDAMAEARRRGLVSEQEVQAILSDPLRLANIAMDIRKLYDAPGHWQYGRLDDNELNAVLSTVARSSYEELLLFNDTFVGQTGIPVAPFLLSFMDASGFINDALLLSSVVDRVDVLRPSNYTPQR